MSADDANLPAPRARHDGWTPARQSRFLEVLAETGCVRAAASAAGLSDTSAYRLRGRSAGFRAAWDAALARAETDLEAIAYDRLTRGRLRVRTKGGEELWSERVQSDALLLTLMKARMPEKYGGGGANGAARDPRTGRFMTLPPLTTAWTMPAPDAEGFVTVTVRLLPEDADLYCSEDYLEAIREPAWRAWAALPVEERMRAAYESVLAGVEAIEARKARGVAG